VADAQLVQPIDDGRADCRLRAHRPLLAFDTSIR
jgi:hypothetical protein